MVSCIYSLPRRNPMRTLSAFSNVSTADYPAPGDVQRPGNVAELLAAGRIPDRPAGDSERNGFVSGDCRSYLSRPGFLEGHESRDLPVAIDRQRIVFPAGCRGRRTGRTVKKRMRTPAIRYPHTGAPGATGLHPERVRVESRTFAFYVRDEIHLLRAEFEVEQLRVLDDPRRRDGLRQRQDAPL